MEKRCNRTHFKNECGELKPKKSYNTEKEALKIARFLNTKETVLFLMLPFQYYNSFWVLIHHIHF